MTPKPARSTGTLQGCVPDCLLVAVVTGIGCGLYLPKLGFYADDWAFLRVFRFSADQSVAGLFRSFIADDPLTAARPVQGLFNAILYQLFGMRPLGYHVVLTAVYFLGLCLFYLALRRISCNRSLALAIVLIYGSLPHYATDRMWFSASHIITSMAAYFLSLYADLHQLHERNSWRWPLLSAVSLIVSGLAYETFLPFFLLHPLLVSGKGRLEGIAMTAGERWRLYLRNPVLVFLILVFKRMTTIRANLGGRWLKDALPAAYDATIGVYGIRLAHILRVISQEYWNWSYVAATILVMGLVTGYLFYIRRTLSPDLAPSLPGPLVFAALLAGGFLLTGITYAYFYDYYRVSTSLANRVLIGASVTVALFVVGLSGLLSRVFGRGAASQIVFSVLVGSWCGCGCLINNTIAAFWVKAALQQEVLLREIRQAFPALPRGSSVLLDGFCPFIGPSVTFEIDWDLTGALTLMYGDATLQGDILRPQLKMNDRGVLNLEEKRLFAFDSLYFYDAGKRQVFRIPDLETAVKYRTRSATDPRNACIANIGLLDFGIPIW